MFDYFDMVGTYEQRVVDNYKDGDLVVDTCKVTDSRQPYETGVKHPRYSDGDWVIVEMYDTKAAAQKGHDKWVKIMTANNLPTSLSDVSTATISELMDYFDDEWRNKT